MIKTRKRNIYHTQRHRLSDITAKHLYVQNTEQYSIICRQRATEQCTYLKETFSLNWVLFSKSFSITFLPKTKKVKNQSSIELRHLKPETTKQAYSRNQTKCFDHCQFSNITLHVRCRGNVFHMLFYFNNCKKPF